MRKNRLRKERRKEQNESEEKFEKKNLRQIVSIEGKGGSNGGEPPFLMLFHIISIL